MFLPHIHSASDLVTTHAATREGFLKQALARTEKADPFILEAREFRTALEHVDEIEKLAAIPIPGIRNALLAAAGFSDKARGHLSETEQASALEQVLLTIQEKTGEDWRTELIYRFLLTRGDTLGGRLRNVTGALGGIQLTSAILAALERKGTQPRLTHAPKNPVKVVSVEWSGRLLVFDRRPRFIDKSIDAILLNTLDAIPPGTVSIEQPDLYLACGELKGGIDPAGADEHWKTARTAFDRIRDRFVKPPPLFFVGAAVERAMAEEIFTHLQDGRLTYAANLTVPQQLTDLADWLVTL